MSGRQLTRDELENRLESMEETISNLMARVEAASTKRDDLQEQVWHLEDELTETKQENQELRETVEDQQQEIDALHRERVRLSRRLTGVEDEVGIDHETSKEFADGRRSSPLYLLEHVGPEAVADHPGATLERARVLLENRERWGDVRSNGKYGRHRVLASSAHELKERLEDVRGESLQWGQVYPAMEKLASLGGDHITFDESYGSADTFGKAVVWQEVDR